MEQNRDLRNESMCLQTTDSWQRHQKHTMEKGQIFSIDVGKPDYPYGEDWNLTPTSSYKEIRSKWIKNPNVGYETPRRKHREKLQDIATGNDFLG
jgi:hypothetical protein